jgi:hypothetical protein
MWCDGMYCHRNILLIQRNLLPEYSVLCLQIFVLLRLLKKGTIIVSTTSVNVCRQHDSYTPRYSSQWGLWESRISNESVIGIVYCFPGSGYDALLSEQGFESSEVEIQLNNTQTNIWYLRKPHSFCSSLIVFMELTAAILGREQST